MATPIRTDEHIQQDVLEELRWDARVRPNEIGVTVRNGVVTLSGRVDTYVKKWAAKEAALRVRGVKAVADEVEIQLPTTAGRTDADIADAAVRALEWDALVPTEDLAISVSNGVLTLEGEVDFAYQRQDAERVVRRLAGVRGVSNLLVARPAQSPPSSTELKREIEDALVRRAEIDADRITVDVIEGKAILRGMVSSWGERQEAENIAWSEPGITQVDNQITVGP